MSEIKKLTNYSFKIGEFEFRFTESKEFIYIQNRSLMGYEKVSVPIASLKEAIKKVEEFENE